jgi:hypothetical protein
MLGYTRPIRLIEGLEYTKQQIDRTIRLQIEGYTDLELLQYFFSHRYNYVQLTITTA